MNPGDAAKKALRSEVRARLAGVGDAAWAEASAAISARVMGLEWYRAALVVMTYAPTAGEVDVRAIGRAAIGSGKVVAIPEVGWQAKTLIPRRVGSVDEGLIVRKHGVPEPAEGNPEVDRREIDLILVPGIAFDGSGRRLGRGGGFYDRFLARCGPRTRFVGVALDEQIVGEVPVGLTDVRVNAVVTPTRVLMPVKDDRR